VKSAFFNTLKKIFERDKNVIVLTGDLGYKMFDDFRRVAPPRRFYDMGVAEQNMVSVASGLALSGKKVFCYSIIPFLTMRTFEQIRVDVSWHNLDVKFIGAGAGLAYGFEGFTHFALEDIAVMRSMPNMTILSPSDPAEASRMAILSYKIKGPVYVRIGRGGEENIPLLHDKKPCAISSRPSAITQQRVGGDGILILATGIMVKESILAADNLMMKHKNGINVSVYNVNILQPLDETFIFNLAQKYRAVFTVEEHYIRGGLGSAISEILLEKGYRGIFRRIGVKKLNPDIKGTPEYLRKYYGLDAVGIEKSILKTLLNEV